MSRSAERWSTVPWSAEHKTGGPLDEVFAALYAEFPDLSIERFAVDHVGDDDNGWFLTLTGADADLQIESYEGGLPPFSLESDTDSLFRVTDVPLVVTTLSRWLRALAPSPTQP
ncbi:hypothetical protein [Dactylosporangium sp. CS-033363]|uniref:hypothetical protein n=1 Tax=Dactylosporangium sp. CS-033363 TaxID=3239935 RepID=UPI003D9238B3